MKRVIITGSPRSNGRSAHVAEMLFEANIDERPEDELFLVPVSEIDVGPCIGCDACRELSEVVFRDEDGAERTELRPRCVFDDDMQMVYDLLDEADELTVVSPVYFSGAPALLKCLLDRMQPYFWSDMRKAPKRPATLHVLGEGGDPHGYDALVSEVTSSLACAGFRLERVYDWVGKVSADGEIVAEADVVDVSNPAGPIAPDAELLQEDGEPSQGDGKLLQGDGLPSRGDGHRPQGEGQRSQAGKQRPKLDLSSGSGKRATGNNGSASRGQGAQGKKGGGSSRSPKPKQAKKSASGNRGGARQSGGSGKKARGRG